VLPGISTEQLRSRLNRMVADGMLTRRRYREVPPRVEYELTERAAELMPILGELARWGYEWSWSAPRGSEQIDIGAIFRLAPGLVRWPAEAPDVIVEFIVEDGHNGEPATYQLSATAGRVSISERGTERPHTRVAGTVSAWVAAFSPEADFGRLRMAGDVEAAKRMLGGLLSAEEAVAGLRAA
jgi:hypothetical protein